MSLYDFTRSDWGARPASYVKPLDYSQVRDLIVHYPGTASPIARDDESIRRALRGWQDYHIDKKGWSDLAYNVAVDQMGRVWEGRGYDRRDGATSGRGGTSMSILGMVANNEAPTEQMLAGIDRVFQEALRRNGGAAKGWHSKFVSTTCPGDFLRDWGKLGFPVSGAVTIPVIVEPSRPVGQSLPAPDFPLDNGCHSHGTNAYFGPRYPLSDTRSVSGYYTHREDLLVWQRRMQERGWRIRPDGLYGDETARVARDFQNEKGLAADALVGRDTWNAAWESPVT